MNNIYSDNLKGIAGPGQVHLLIVLAVCSVLAGITGLNESIDISKYTILSVSFSQQLIYYFMSLIYSNIIIYLLYCLSSFFISV